MKRREVPTLVSLAKRSMREGSSKKAFVEDVPKRTLEAIKITGAGGGECPREQPSQGEAAGVSCNGESSSSGRTSSLGGDSSGIGSSLTSSSSSEPIERDALSPSSENGVSGDSAEDVPENVPVDGDDALEDGNIGNSDSCQVLMLAEEYDGQMSAAKKFLQMVREGIKDGEDASSVSTTPNRSTLIKGANEVGMTEEDAAKFLILNNNNNSFILEKSPGEGASGRSTSMSTVAPQQVPVSLNGITQQLILEKGPPPACVQEVWAHNLLEEFAIIRRVVQHYNFIAMDTEFPGIVIRPQCPIRTAGGAFPYELLKGNVDRLKIIQLGLTFMDKNGRTPPGVCTWQFNFKFNLHKDIYASDSISLLTRCGIQFERHAEMGINPEAFGEYFMSSGMVTNDRVTYLTFHSGFDFGYLIKLLSNLPLPENEEKFFETMKIYFPNVYDLKFLMKSVDLHGGLQDIANQLGQVRVGAQHQAGSDSLLTGMTFFKLLQTEVFNGEIDESKYCGKLYGFHMTAEDGRDEGWIPSDILDPTSPKPQLISISRSSNLNTNSSYIISNGNLLSTVLLPPQHSAAGSSTNIAIRDANNR